MKTKKSSEEKATITIRLTIGKVCVSVCIYVYIEYAYKLVDPKGFFKDNLEETGRRRRKLFHLNIILFVTTRCFGQLNFTSLTD